MGNKNFKRVRTQAEKIKRSMREGTGNPVQGYRESAEQKAVFRVLVQKHGGCCVFCERVCNKTEGSPRRATIDHIVPVSKGGSELISNKQLACSECNQLKGNMSMDEFLAKYPKGSLPVD